MIPMAWKKEFETTFRQPGADRTYEGLVAQLLAIGNEERYMSNRLGPNDMETDNLEKIRYWDDPEAITAKMYEGAEPQGGHQREREYSEAEWIEWQSYIEQEIDYLGKSGKGGKGGKSGKGYGGKGYGGGGKGYGAKGGSQSGKGRDDWKPQDAKDVICLWCHVKGHFRKDCKELAAYKLKRDAERAAKGDHSVYVNPRAGKGQGPSRGAGSLDDDYTEEVVGLMGDIEADSLDEIADQKKLLQEIEDFEEADDDKNIQEEDDWEQICGIVESDSGVFVRHESCECCPTAVLTEEEMIITPERKRQGNEWRAVSGSTPLADLFENQKSEDSRSSTPIVCLPGSSTTRSIAWYPPPAELPPSSSSTVRYELGKGPAKQSLYQCKWDVLSVCSDEPDSDSDECVSIVGGTVNHMAEYETDEQGFYECERDDESDDEECCGLIDSEDEEDTLHIPANRLTAHQRDRRELRLARELANKGASRRQSSLESSGSATGLALRTDETAEARNYDHHAVWQGSMSKPAVKRGWPAKRRA